MKLSVAVAVVDAGRDNIGAVGVSGATPKQVGEFAKSFFQTII